MEAYYQRLIHSRYFPLFLGMLVGGYIFFFFNLLILDRTPLVQFIEVNRYPFLDFSTNFQSSTNYIINVNPLRDQLQTLVKQVPSNSISLYFESLNTGSNISINQNTQIFPASLAKLPLALVIMNKVENGQMSLADQITIEPDDVDNRSGDLYKTAIPGAAFSVDQLLSALLVDSDDTAQHALLRQITPGDMQDLIDATGLSSLADANGRISSKEYTRFFRALFFASYLDRGDSQKILKLLSQATFHDFLSQGLPSNVLFSHKYGEDVTNKIYSDSGIVYLKNRPYMLTVMIQNTDEKTAQELMKEISAAVYNYMFTTQGVQT